VARGAKVAVTARKLADAEAAAGAMAGPGETLPLALEVSDADSVAAAVAAVVERWGSPEILVNNAGITRDGLILRMQAADWREVIDANLTGTFLCSKECLRKMVRARKGAIVNRSSVVGGLGNPGQANYCASKAGIEGLTRSLAREYANRNVRVNAVAPGFISTAMTDALDEKARAELQGQIPLQRLGGVDDVAEAVLFLASARASYITGQVLHVNGGMYMG
ncbi:MAG TPA: 3-oxoacyl-ACP reductase FabG, partial [Deferrisomatales bacterium]|nr:3-oxoacyl-ACP reductase FabG [Deferrisomatales bacterium]